MKININIILVLFKILYAKKPYRRQDQAIWKIECELGFLFDPDCPIDGGWSAWGAWSSCRGLCDDIGHKERVRECNNPPPSNEGISCSGPSVQTDICYLTNCTVDDFRKLVVGDNFRKEALQQLELVPALLERCVQMECFFEYLKNSLAAENNFKLEPENYWNSLHCVKYNIGCPIVGSWSTWGPWSPCSALCGSGFRWKLRKCDAPPPSASYLTCEGLPLYTEKCYGEHCAIDEDANNSLMIWDEWSEWSKCSVQCGMGVRHRKRVCLEKRVPQSGNSWGTHCRGSHEELEGCFNEKCVLDGGWTGWAPWGPCSQTCGIGRRSRVRSCSRPMPSGGGANCSGPRTEICSCYLTPCEAYTHTVAVLNGESLLHYNIANKRSTLLHVYMRFKTLSQYGTLLRRGTINGPHVRITLQKLHICVDISGETSSCSLSRICSLNAIQPEKWHSIMVSITTKAIYLTIDNFQPKFKEKFPCDPNLLNEVLSFRVGEKFNGEIQEIIINFTPLELKAIKNGSSADEFSPFFASNIGYEKALIDEAYLELTDGQYLRLPCFENQDEWNIELKFKTLKESGLLLLLLDEHTDNWLFVTMQNRRIKFNLILNDLKSEGVSSKDYPIDQWLDIYLSKKKDSTILQAILNGHEHLHIITTEEQMRRRRNERTTQYDTSNNNKTLKISLNFASFPICSDDLFIGGNPKYFEKSNYIPPFNVIIASIAINGILKDLIKSDVETNIHDTFQVSSRAASVSKSYRETFWGQSKLLNLSCVHARRYPAYHKSQWFKLDIGIRNMFPEKKVRSTDNGRVLRLRAKADDDLIDFYTCRTYGNRRTGNIITYGVVGDALKFHGPNTVTIISLCSTICLLIITIGWLLLEGMRDLRNGYGFFRDQHLSPEAEAEAICEFIDRNAHMIGSKNAIDKSKFRARQAAKKYIRREVSKCTLIKQSNSKQLEKASEKTSTESDSVTLPVAVDKPETSTADHKIYRCVETFVSSPRHGSPNSPERKLSSVSNFELSPRLPCSRFYLGKRNITKQSNLSWRKSHKTLKNASNQQPENQVNLTMSSIASSRILNPSPAQKVLQKFKELK